jgi:hypothetical protein
MQFKAFAFAYKFIEAIQVTADKDLPDTETPDPAESQDQQNAREKNRAGMVYLTMSLTNPDNQMLLFRARTTKWPSGLAHVIVKALVDR